MDYSDYLAGYGVLMMGVREAHLLNPVSQRPRAARLGRILLHHFIRVARGCEADHIFLEVCPSNQAARALCGHRFRELYVRRTIRPIPPRRCHPHGLDL
jgi:hypothetical protein